jgi:hypothetical protein
VYLYLQDKIVFGLHFVARTKRFKTRQGKAIMVEEVQKEVEPDLEEEDETDEEDESLNLNDESDDDSDDGSNESLDVNIVS